jgi:hypothetical protein
MSCFAASRNAPASVASKTSTLEGVASWWDVIVALDVLATADRRGNFSAFTKYDRICVCVCIKVPKSFKIS